MTLQPNMPHYIHYNSQFVLKIKYFWLKNFADLTLEIRRWKQICVACYKIWDFSTKKLQGYLKASLDFRSQKAIRWFKSRRYNLFKDFFLVPLFLFLNSAPIKIMVKTFKTTTLPKTYLCGVLSVEYIVISLGMELISSFNSGKPQSTLTGISNGILSKICP